MAQDANQTEQRNNPQDLEQLKLSLLRQLEYYFSKENLERDEYLKSQMNADFFVPIATIANFKMVRSLTSDLQLILEVLKGSREVVVHENNELVRPNIKQERTTLILRDIAPETPVEEIEKIFQRDGCAPVKSVKPEIGNTWFITFETEKEALATLDVIRSLTFQGKAIQARVKSENPLKSLLIGHHHPADQLFSQTPYPSWQNNYSENFPSHGHQGFGGSDGIKYSRGPLNGRGRGGRTSYQERESTPKEFQAHSGGRHTKSDRVETPNEPREDFEKQNGDFQNATQSSGAGNKQTQNISDQQIKPSKGPLNPESFPPLPGNFNKNLKEDSATEVHKARFNEGKEEEPHQQAPSISYAEILRSKATQKMFASNQGVPVTERDDASNESESKLVI